MDIGFILQNVFFYLEDRNVNFFWLCFVQLNMFIDTSVHIWCHCVNISTLNVFDAVCMQLLIIMILFVTHEHVYFHLQYRVLLQKFDITFAAVQDGNL